ncbi:MAG: 30S processome protein Utp24 [Desulfurococcaceae archaeon]
MSRRPVVVLDTNMLMLIADGIPVLDHIREELEAEPRFIVIKPVYDELLKIAYSNNGKIRKKALFAIEIAEKYCEITEYELRKNENVDDAILRFALENKAIVATNDKILRARLREAGIPEAYFREEARRVKVEGYYK